MRRPYRHWKTGALAALSCLLFFQTTGWFLVCQFRQAEAKKAAGVAMSATNTPLYTVTIPAGRFSRIRVGKKEVRLGGQLFDIKNQRVCGDSIALTLYHDRDEEKALHTLSVLLAPDTGAGDASAPPLYQWLSRWLGTFYLPPVVPEIHPPATLAFHSVFRCLVPVAQAGPGCFSPPPEG